MQVNGMTDASAIHVDVIGDKDGYNRARTLGTASILGIFPHTLDASLKAEGHCGGFHVDIEAGTTYVRDVESGAEIFKGRGFAKTMQALADAYGVDVVVGHDPGASSTIANARYVTSKPMQAEAEAAPVAEAEAVHAIGRESMFCGLPIDAPVRAFTRMSYVTCEACKAAAPVIKTADRVKVTDGLAVFDYDLNPGRVDLGSLTADGWFDVIKADGSRSIMDGSRVVTVRNGQTAEAVLSPAPVAPIEVEAAPVAEAARDAKAAALIEAERVARRDRPDVIGKVKGVYGDAPINGATRVVVAWGELADVTAHYAIGGDTTDEIISDLILVAEAAPVPVFVATTDAEIEALDAVFGPVADDCVCDEIFSAGPSHEERTCPGCGSVFEAVPRVGVRIGDRFTDTVAEITVTVAATSFIGCPDILFSAPDGSFFRVPPMLLACRVRDGEYVRLTRPGHLVTSAPVRTNMRRRARKAARKGK